MAIGKEDAPVGEIRPEDQVLGQAEAVFDEFVFSDKATGDENAAMTLIEHRQGDPDRQSPEKAIDAFLAAKDADPTRPNSDYRGIGAGADEQRIRTWSNGHGLELHRIDITPKGAAADSETSSTSLSVAYMPRPLARAFMEGMAREHSYPAEDGEQGSMAEEAAA